MPEESNSKKNQGSTVSRRDLLATGAGLAAASAVTACTDDESPLRLAATGAVRDLAGVPTAPFDTFREYMAAIEAYGCVLRVPRLDQDAYEMTALMYRLVDEYGWYEAPAILAEEVKIDGKWVKGPVITNNQGHWYTEAITFGVEPILNDGVGTYRKAMAHLESLLVKGEYPQIPTVEVSREKALCKQVVLRGADIDLTQFAFIKSNPADSRRYVNTGSVFTSDPDMGSNFGTYRCELRGPRLIGLNPEPNQTGWKMLMAAKARGEKIARVSVAVGQDPVTWIVSGSRIANRLIKKPIDELAIAGGIRGKAIEVVRSETNDHMVPANCEMIIEGEVPLDKTLPEGPFGEMYQYLGPRKSENFFMNVTAVTHRRDPWILDQFTGVTKGYNTGPTAVLFNNGLRRLVPGLIEIHSPVDANGLSYVRIKKTKPGEGMLSGQKLAKIIPIYKIIVVVDEDVDVLDRRQVEMALGSRWQPSSASDLMENIRGMPLDPSVPGDNMTSKIVIDATKKWPEEGGPEKYAELNRALLEELAPESFELVNEKFSDVIPRRLKTF